MPEDSYAQGLAKILAQDLGCAKSRESRQSEPLAGMRVVRFPEDYASPTIPTCNPAG